MNALNGFIIRQAGEIEVNGPDGVERVNGLLLEGDVSHIRLAAVWFGERVTVAPIASPSQRSAVDVVEALRSIKKRVCGDRAPNWNSDTEVSRSRFWIAEKTDAALASLTPQGGERCSDCPPVGYPTDETRCLPCDRRASPQPANPAQVTDKRAAWLAEAKYDALVEEAKDFAERMTSQPWACELIERLLGALTAAIGAGGQAVAVKPMIWEEDHGIAGMGPYRLFKAETPLGRFVYGTDAEGSAYYHTASSGVMMVGDEAKAKQLAEAAWQKAALAEVGRFVDPVALSQPHPADERVEALDGAAMIAAERRRQIEEEGWTAEHDDTEYHNGELGRAAAAYALSGMKVYQLPVDLVRRRKGIIADIWPWGQEWFKPRGKPDAVIRSLVKAGALIAAEIDQQQRRRALSAKEGR